MRHDKYVSKIIDDKGTVALVAKTEDVWYVLKYDVNQQAVIITYFNQDLPLNQQKPIRRIIKTSYDETAEHAVFVATLDNYELHKNDTERFIEYDPVRRYTKPTTGKGSRYNLYAVRNNFKIPKPFRKFFFKVDDLNSTITLRTFITLADIEELRLDTKAMNSYLDSLKEFVMHDEESGWV